MEYFRDKVVLVTGAAAGIGEGLVRRLAKVGAHVVAADLNAPAVDALATELAAGDQSVIAVKLDVRNAEEFEEAVRIAMDRFGRLDLLFNNAGVGLAGALQDTSIEDWNRVIDVNVWGVINGVQVAYPVMIRQGFGQIVNIASAAGLAPRPGMVPYATSKSAVVGLSTSLRAEAADYGIRVNTVCPLTVATSIFDNTVYKGLDKKELLADVPIKPFPLDKCITRILNGVRRNRAVITVQFLAWVEWWLYRVCPWMVALFVNPRRKLFRRHRRAES